MSDDAKLAAFALEAARYFENRPVNGEDTAHWSNVTNAETMRKIAARLSQAGAGGGVVVRPLEWAKPPTSLTLRRADTILGSYTTWTHHEADGEWYWSGPALPDGATVCGAGTNEAEVTAAAQADYEARILSAIATPPATPVQPTASVEAVDLHDFLTHRRAWRKALEMALAASDSMANAEYWSHEIKAFDRAFDLIAPLASLTPAPTQGETGQNNAKACEQVATAVLDWLTERGLYDARDYADEGPDVTELLSMHEAELLRASPSSPVSATSPAGGVREAVDLHDFITHRTAWRNALIICEGSAQAKGDEDNRSYWSHEIGAFDRAFTIIEPLARTFLSSPATPEPVSAPANGEVELVRAATALINNLWQDVWSYDRTHEENWKEFDRRYPGMKWLRDARDAALSKPEAKS